MHKVTIYYRDKHLGTIRELQRRLHLPQKMTVNGEWPVMVDDATLKELKLAEEQGLIDIRNNFDKFQNMSVTKAFEEVIGEYLQKEAEKDEQFAKKMAEQPEKDTKATCEYILKEVSNAGRNGWTDDEIFGMAKHFIDEKEVKVGSYRNKVSKIVTNRHAEDPKPVFEEDARKAAEKRFYEELKQKKMEAEAKKRQKEREKAEAKKAEALAEAKKEAALSPSLFGDDF